jgi:mRNA-degrading endonuclease YafQ of YafQ-DinJ toxin-antitoxin module
MPLEFTGRFERKYARLPLNIRINVKKALKLLENNFRHPGLRSHPVEGYPDIYEAYVDKKYRLTFERSENVLTLRNVDNHDECLRNP